MEIEGGEGGEVGFVKVLFVEYQPGEVDRVDVDGLGGVAFEQDGHVVGLDGHWEATEVRDV